MRAGLVCRSLSKSGFVSLFGRGVNPHNLLSLIKSARSGEKIIELLEKGESVSRENTWLNHIYLAAYRQAGKTRNPQLIGELARRSIALQGMKFEVPLMNSIMLAVAECGKPEEAEHIFHQIRATTGSAPEVTSYGIMAKIYVSQMALDKLDDLFDSMEGDGIKPNATIYSTILDFLARTRNVPEAYKYLNKLRHEGDAIVYDKWLYNSILSVYVAARRAPEALELLREIQVIDSAHLSKEHFNTVLDVFANLGDKETVAKLYGEMEKLFPLDTYTYTTVLRAFLTNSRLHPDLAQENAICAEEFFSQMTANKIFPTLLTLNTMIEIFGELPNIEKIRTYENLIHARGFKPNGYTLTALAQAYRKAGKEEMSKKLTEQLLSRGGDGGTADPEMFLKISSLLQENRIEEAVDRLSGTSNEHALTYNEVLRFCSRRNFPEQFEATRELMVKRGVRPNAGTYRHILVELSKRKRPPEAVMEILKTMDERGVARQKYHLMTVMRFAGRLSWAESNEIFSHLMKHDRALLEKNKDLVHYLIEQTTRAGAPGDTLTTIVAQFCPSPDTLNDGTASSSVSDEKGDVNVNPRPINVVAASGMEQTGSINRS